MYTRNLSKSYSKPTFQYTITFKFICANIWILKSYRVVQKHVSNVGFKYFSLKKVVKQARKHPLDTPKRKLEGREREGEREKVRRRDKEREGVIGEREREREREA